MNAADAGGGVALVIGATSDIGRATARGLGARMRVVQLAGRDVERLEAEANDLRIRTGARVTVHRCEVPEADGDTGLVNVLEPLADVVVCVVGVLGDQSRAQREPRAAEEIIAVNYVGPALLLGALAERFEARGSGTLVGIGSVAGDRGRGSNYVYGSAKAGFAAFLSGLRNRLASKGVHVVTVKPGYVRTRMTDDMDLPALLTADPDEVADAIVQAIDGRRDVVYVRRRWRFLMWLVRAIPERAFKRLSL